MSITRLIAFEYAPDRVRVNAIAPGLTLSERATAMLKERQEVQKLRESQLPGDCEPDDMAHMAVYLASAESRVVTGQIMSVDSGVTIY